MTIKKTVLAAAITLATAGIAQAASVSDAIKEGDAIIDLNLRYETNDEDGNTLDAATALTLRSRLGYETASFSGFKFLYEIEDVRAIKDEYKQEDSSFDGIADPENTEINRAQVSYAKESFGAVAGRQRIILDNARFVGNVGWRQNEQTFDAVKLTYKTDELTATYVYVDQVNGILRDFDADVTDHLINVAYKLPVGTLTGYAYLTENDDTEATNDTMGVRLKGKSSGVMYTVEYATQTADSGVEREATYWTAELGTAISDVKVFAGMETLGSDDGAYGFQTPLATKHAFNGWADKFLKTPGSGLQDTYVKAVTKVAGVKLLGMYHDYSSDEGGIDFGSEINLLAAYKIDKNFTVGAKMAKYSAGDDDSGKADTDKLWVWASAKF